MHERAYLPITPTPPSHMYGNEKRNVHSTLWSILGFVSFAGAILLIVGAVLPSWRSTSTITYHYMSSGSPSTRTVYSSSYGLYLIHFNAPQVAGTESSRFVSKTWYQHKMTVCSYFTNNILWFAASCKDACQRHMSSRCYGYRKISFWGYLALGTLIASACLALLGAIWVFVFTPQHSVLLLLWLGGGCASSVVSCGWLWVTSSTFTSFQRESQYPFPSISSAVYVTAAGIALILCCGIATLMLGYLSNRTYFAQRQQEIDKRIVGDYAPQPPGGAFGPGLMTTMPNANMYNRPPLPVQVFGSPFAMPPRQPGLPPPPASGYSQGSSLCPYFPRPDDMNSKFYRPFNMVPQYMPPR